ncbi:hypothetical protein BMS3Bbin06_01403 [bacterium BMS3Bbin06]|nr:hypothetical protein BMS3Abin08_01822 [bacterium BMS3Abin08]GBE34869.1 hypothetical protein BMS3Bbin06_01403 [bacterium BMS3Bbin06]HDO35894.1 CcmD family protein [Nitrospirota bacterium]HDY71831.1 CcmD family protein [Nitrospirota bacterium]
MDNLIYLFGAYTVAWFGMLVYTYRSTRKLEAIETRIDDLESSLNLPD